MILKDDNNNDSNALICNYECTFNTMIMTIIILIMILYIKQKKKVYHGWYGYIGYGTEKDKLRHSTERRISYGTDILVWYSTERRIT